VYAIKIIDNISDADAFRRGKKHFSGANSNDQRHVSHRIRDFYCTDILRQGFIVTTKVFYRSRCC